MFLKGSAEIFYKGFYKGSGFLIQISIRVSIRVLSGDLERSQQVFELRDQLDPAWRFMGGYKSLN